MTLDDLRRLKATFKSQSKPIIIFTLVSSIRFAWMNADVDHMLSFRVHSNF